MTPEIKEFIEQLDARLTELQHSDNPKQNFKDMMASDEGKKISSVILQNESFFESEEFTEFCMKHIWII